ncbi:hypothetical protein AB0F24_11475 [Streptomyces platensis]|uniref:hypothetical protein n=1 Tax=Streptomyces platensis TaxID=58346 RepID=UPI0033F349A8
MAVESRFPRLDRYVTFGRTLPYVWAHGVRKQFRAAPPARASTAALTDPEFGRVVHDIYSDMFLRGYQQVTAYRVDRATGLVAVLFAVFICAFDDEFEQRRASGATSHADEIIAAPAVDEVWRTIGAYLRATGRDDAVRQYIWHDFLGSGFDRYRTDVEAVERGAGLPATVRVVEFDSGEALRTAYHLIRIFNGHPYHEGCAEQFRRLGLAGKYLDDMADYTADVTSGSPNLLDAVAGLWPDELAAARSAVAEGEVVTKRWWRERCPRTYERYLREIAEHYDHVRAPALRLPLDIYSALLRTRRFWTVSTVRASQRAG